MVSVDLSSFILLFGFLLFGPDKLPAMAKTLGKAIGKFRNAQEEMNKVIKNEVYDSDSDEPFTNPLDVMEKAADAGKKAANGASKAVSSASKVVSSHSSSATAPKPPRRGSRKASASARPATIASAPPSRLPKPKGPRPPSRPRWPLPTPSRPRPQLPKPPRKRLRGARRTGSARCPVFRNRNEGE